MPPADDLNSSSFLLDKPGEVVEKLRVMARQRSLLSLTIAGSGGAMGSMVLTVLPERGLVVLDPSANSRLNRQLLEAASARCETQVNGIEARFDLSGFQQVDLEGQTLLAATIPDNLFWRQRRAFYRVSVPFGRVVKCRIQLRGEGAADFAVHNLSLVGIALLDNAALLRETATAGQILGPCRLLVPGLDDDQFSLELRNRIEPLRRDDLLSAVRLGAAFRGIGRSFEVKLQKYIFELEREFRRGQDANGS
jgi:flagellar brake protein